MERKTVNLADGTVVRLNAGSRLRWRTGLDGEIRDVSLRGQGYFEVAEDDRPFVVNTENARIRVWGTEFEVWTRNQTTRVTVRGGRVSLSGKNGSDRIFLTRNQSGRMIGGRIQAAETVDADELLGWLDGRLVFKQQPLSEVILDLEQIFGVALNLKESRLGKRRVTASFEHIDLEIVLSEICLALNLEYVTDGNQTTLLEK